ncbi:hypothetical protein C8R44DRAFT_744660 [Mycena epipterygia]|nr:hypothetical protein C8R44DRAFT_744660 [Mycena epipterygia]
MSLQAGEIHKGWKRHKKYGPVMPPALARFRMQLVIGIHRQWVRGVSRRGGGRVWIRRHVQSHSSGSSELRSLYIGIRCQSRKEDLPNFENLKTYGLASAETAIATNCCRRVSESDTEWSGRSDLNIGKSTRSEGCVDGLNLAAAPPHGSPAFGSNPGPGVLQNSSPSSHLAPPVLMLGPLYFTLGASAEYSRTGT